MKVNKHQVQRKYMRTTTITGLALLVASTTHPSQVRSESVIVTIVGRVLAPHCVVHTATPALRLNPLPDHSLRRGKRSLAAELSLALSQCSAPMAEQRTPITITVNGRPHPANDALYMVAEAGGTPAPAVGLRIKNTAHTLKPNQATPLFLPNGSTGSNLDYAIYYEATSDTAFSDHVNTQLQLDVSYH